MHDLILMRSNESTSFTDLSACEEFEFNPSLTQRKDKIRNTYFSVSTSLGNISRHFHFTNISAATRDLKLTAEISTLFIL